ncbi:MAG TPA: hypothetical protein VE987_14690 [Polyangiaceae bacterium]|nr:hypothetical protein [Polyangiaceae bacterium]
MSTSTQLDALYKQRYPDGLEDLTFRDRPLLALVGKKTDLGGANATTSRAYHVPFRYAFPSAVSGSFSYASTRAASVSSRVVAWELYTMHQYSFINIDNESLKRSIGNENAFLELRGFEFDGAVENLANRLHNFLYGDGTGVIAQVGNATQMPSFAVSVLVLFNSEDAARFAYGDELDVSATRSSATNRAYGANGHGLYVIGVNMDAGTITVGNAAGTAVNLNDANDGIPTIANLDFIAHRGDHQVAGTLGGTVLDGFQQWVPSLATGISGGDNQYSVNRSVAPDLLAGSRFDGTSYGIEEAFIRGANVVAKKQGKISNYFTTHKHYSDLVSAIASRGVVNFLEFSPADKPDIGFEGVHIIGANSGAIDVIPDYACPSTVGVGMLLDKWQLVSVGETIQIMNTDGNETLRLPTADGVSAYWYSYSNFVPMSPRDNVNVTLPF